MIQFLIILVAAVLIVIGPLAVLWALNTLFMLGIPYTFWTWLAVWILAGLFKTKVEVSK